MNKLVLQELMSMRHRDIELREHLKPNRPCSFYTKEMQQIHTENAHRLHAIIEQHGWPGISLVGEEGCRAACLIAQHAICTPELQLLFLDLMHQASLQYEVPKQQLAYLTDRIRFNQHKPQVYGTVVDWNHLGELYCEVEDPESVDQRRQQVGLPPLQQELEKHRKTSSLEPPADPLRYLLEKQQWALNVGWISTP